MSVESLKPINVPDLLSALEPFIRRVVREELAATKSTPAPLHLQPDSPFMKI